MKALSIFVERAGAFVLGLLTVLLLHATFGWWLNSGTGVLRATLVMLAVSFLVALRRTGMPWVRAIFLWGGVISGWIVALIWTGPGTIWPIVLATAAMISGAAVFGGVLLTSFARYLRHARP